MNDWMNISHYIVMNFWNDDMWNFMVHYRCDNVWVHIVMDDGSDDVDWYFSVMNDWSCMVDSFIVMHWEFVVDYRSNNMNWNVGMMHWYSYLSKR